MNVEYVNIRYPKISWGSFNELEKLFSKFH